MHFFLQFNDEFNSSDFFWICIIILLFLSDFLFNTQIAKNKRFIKC